jgi:hypothetical protein
MASEKVQNYTAEQTKQLVQSYQTGEFTLEQLAADFGKSVRSVVAKLSTEKVYARKPDASGVKRATKEQLVDQLAGQLGLTGTVLASLEKATKEALVALTEAVSKLLITEMD